MTAAWNRTKGTDSSISDFLHLTTDDLEAHEETYRQLVKCIPDHFFDEMKAKFVKEIAPDFKENGTLSSYSKGVISLLASGIVSLYIDYFNGRSEMGLRQIEDCCNRTIDSILAGAHKALKPFEPE
jgi:hypothetical protein